MNSATATASKQTWSRSDTLLVTRCYLEGKTLQETHLIMPDIKLTALKTKLACCMYLDRRDLNAPFASRNVSKMHQDVWDELKGALTVPVPEEASVPEEGSGYWSDDHEEDGETYFMCAGSCARVCHYEDTNEHGMCGKCEYKSQRKGRK